ncbi:MAG: BLUF domain-containing protein [Sphingobacteriaceae bacterium]|nr:MAG: BLUF domain-containing protein [Sphingobacteriaceae bacterium]
MYFLIYTSYAKSTNEQMLSVLLVQAREKNKACGITGMLLYVRGTFIQLIEGEQAQVKSLYKVIQRDERHLAPVVLMEGEIAERFFSNWSMGYKSISAEQLASEESYKCLNSPSEENKHEIIQLFRILLNEHANYLPVENSFR